MSVQHPIIAVTGSSGAGTSSVKNAFEHIFLREAIKPAIIEGDSYHRYDRAQMQAKIQTDNISHFGAQANDFGKLADTFKTYANTGQCQRRYYLHNDEEAIYHNTRLGIDQTAGSFTPWETIKEKTDLLFYEGLHGLVQSDQHDIAQYVDLGIGVAPIVNLEWIQKIHRDNKERGYSAKATVDTILRRLPDYIRYITPQFSITDINFQRVPTVDTSNPFIARDIPAPDESFVVIRFKDPKKFDIDFQYLLAMIDGSFMSRRNSIVIPGGKMGFAIEVILAPIIHDMLKNKLST